MLTYPLLAVALGYDPKTTGIFLGATIHDVAQVVGAGYAVSGPVGNAAVIVKLFRVFLLLPVVLGIGWWLAAAGRGQGHATRAVRLICAWGFTANGDRALVSVCRGMRESEEDWLAIRPEYVLECAPNLVQRAIRTRAVKDERHDIRAAARQLCC